MIKYCHLWIDEGSCRFCVRICFCFCRMSCVKKENNQECVDENVEEVHINWFGCEGIELTEEQREDVEQLFDIILNDEMYFDESDAWVMEFMLFENFLPKGYEIYIYIMVRT